MGTCRTPGFPPSRARPRGHEQASAAGNGIYARETKEQLMSDTPDRSDPVCAGSSETAETETAETHAAETLAPRRRAGRGRRVAVILTASALTLLCTVAVAGYTAIHHLMAGVRTIPNVFQGMDQSARPVMPPAARHSLTILLAGSDSRSTTPTAGAGAAKMPVEQGMQRSDLLMLVHIDADRKRVAFVSIPRDSWVPVPGYGMMKVNAALSLGGPRLMIATVERLTHVRVDHYAVIDFHGFRSMVQALGDVDVDVAEPTASGGVNFHRGLNKLSPTTALAYVRQRDSLPEGDLSRIQRQQNFIRAILAKTAAEHVLTQPLTLYRLLDAFTHALSVDSTYTGAQMRSLALQLHSLRGSDVAFLTAPVRGLGWEDQQSVVHLDSTKCAALWSAIRHDAVAAFAKRYPATVTPAAPN